MRFPREFYIPKGAVKVRDKASSAVAYLTEHTNRFGTRLAQAVCFSGKRNKPDSNYLYRSAEERARAVAEHFARVQETERYRAARQAARKGVDRGLEVGDVLQRSWGYDQTNIDYYEVTALIGASMVEIRELAQESVETGFMSGKCVPLPGQYVGAPMRKRAANGSVRITSYGGYASKVEPTVIAGAKVFNASAWTAYA